MSDLKISQLGPFSETDVVASDVLPLADVSAQQTKKIAASDLVKAGARLNADTITFGNNVVVTGNFTVNGTTTTIDTTTLRVEDKNIEMGVVATPTDVTANGGGITLKGTTDKTINWLDATDSWTSSENVDLASGKSYRINNTEVLNSTTLGSGVTSSSLTSVGTVTTGTWQGTTVATGYGGTGQTTYSNGQLLIGKTDGTLAKSTITAGSGVTVTNGDGAITIAATGSSGTVTNVTGTAPISVANGTTTPSISIAAASTSAAGAVQLTDSTSSTSTTTAATPNAVKSAYDLADAALPEAGGTMTGALGVTAGTAAAPGVFFSGDTNTGIYSPGADQVAISTGGTGRVFIDSSGRVGIGTASPSQLLNVSSSGTATVSCATSDTSGPSIGRFRAVYAGGGGGTASFVDLRAGSGYGYLLAESNVPLLFGTNNTERLRITETGLVGIGNNVPGYSLDVSSATDNYGLNTQPVTGTNRAGLRIANTSGGFVVGIDNSAGGIFGSTTAYERAIYSSGAYPLRFYTNDTRAMTIDSSQRVGIGTSPSQLLHIKGSGDAKLLINSSNNASDRGIYFATSTDSEVLGYIKQEYTTGNLDISSGTGSYGSVIAFRTAGTERARVDQNGRLLVGTSSHTASTRASFTGHSSSGTGEGIAFFQRGSAASSGNRLGDLRFSDNSDISFAGIAAEADGTVTGGSKPGRLLFSTTADGASSPTERMRITNAGKVLINTTSVIDSQYALNVGVSSVDGGIVTKPSASGTYTALGFFNYSSTQVGSITPGASSTAYNTSSDYRLKENIVAVTDGITRLQQLKPSRFNFTAEPDRTVDGFVAHEVQAVVPEAITGEKDAVDDNGNPVYQGIDQSKLVPLLTAALQEAVAKIESLEARLTAAGI